MAISDGQLANIERSGRAGYDQPNLSASVPFNEFEAGHEVEKEPEPVLPLDFLKLGDELILSLEENSGETRDHTLNVIATGKPVSVLNPHNPVSIMGAKPESGRKVIVRGSILGENSMFSPGLLRPGHRIQVEKPSIKVTEDELMLLRGGRLKDFRVNRPDVNGEKQEIANRGNINQVLEESTPLTEKSETFQKIEEIFGRMQGLRQTKPEFIGKEGAKLEDNRYALMFETLGVEPLAYVSFYDSEKKQLITIEKVDPKNSLRRNYETYTVTVITGSEGGSPVITERTKTAVRYNVSTHQDLDGSAVILRVDQPFVKPIEGMGIQNKKNGHVFETRPTSKAPEGFKVTQNAGLTRIEHQSEGGINNKSYAIDSSPDLSDLSSFLIWAE
jgi:hypothetical protein